MRPAVFSIALCLLMIVLAGSVAFAQPEAADSSTSATISADGEAPESARVVPEEETTTISELQRKFSATLPFAGALVVLLCCSCFFSGSETALFSLSRVELMRLEREPKVTRAEKAIITLMDRASATLTTILIGNMMVNVGTSLTIAAMVNLWVGGYPILSFLIGTVLATLALLILGEIFPKTVAIARPLRFARTIAIPLLIFEQLITPLRFFFLRASAAIFRALRLPREAEGEAVTEQEIKGLVMMGHVEGVIQADQREMIEGVFEINDETVDSIMTPRVELEGYPADIERGELLEALRQGIHSRVLLYEESVDNVIGVLHMKDLLLSPDGTPRDLMRQPLVVPEKKTLASLLNHFRRQHQHLAVVIDEYGGTAGCVSMNDLLEEIFGQTVDLNDESSLPGLRTVGPGEWEVDGRLRIDDLNEELDIELPEDAHTTLSGLITNSLGEFPRPGVELRIGEVKLVVRKMAARRVALARLTLLGPLKRDKERREGTAAPIASEEADANDTSNKEVELAAGESSSQNSAAESAPEEAKKRGE